MPREIDLRSKIENVRIITPLLLGPYGIKLFVEQVEIASCNNRYIYRHSIFAVNMIKEVKRYFTD